MSVQVIYLYVNLVAILFVLIFLLNVITSLQESRGGRDARYFRDDSAGGA